MSVQVDASARHSVLLVEDDPPTRARLERAIQALDEMDLVAAVGTCAEARAAISQRVPDILLTDLGLPDGDGDELIRELAVASPKTLSLVVTVFADERTVIRALEAGARGYLLKDATMDGIGAGLRDIIDGGAPISPSIARYLLKRFRAKPAAPKPSVTLTAREIEVLTMVAKGFSCKECAELLGISSHTVTTHVQKTYRKLSVSSRGEAVYEAVQMGLIDLDS